jgi:hypothetical protein
VYQLLAKEEIATHKTNFILDALNQTSVEVESALSKGRDSHSQDQLQEEYEVCNLVKDSVMAGAPFAGNPGTTAPLDIIIINPCHGEPHESRVPNDNQLQYWFTEPNISCQTPDQVNQQGGIQVDQN